MKNINPLARVMPRALFFSLDCVWWTPQNLYGYIIDSRRHGSECVYTGAPICEKLMFHIINIRLSAKASLPLLRAYLEVEFRGGMTERVAVADFFFVNTHRRQMSVHMGEHVFKTDSQQQNHATHHTGRGWDATSPMGVIHTSPAHPHTPRPSP